MKTIKLLLSAPLALALFVSLTRPDFQAMPRFMDRYDADPMAKLELKGKCTVCHKEENGFGPLNAAGKAFAESGYRITDSLRAQAGDVFLGGKSAAVAAFDAKAYYAKNCAGCHGVDGKGGDVTMAVPNFKNAAWQQRRTEQNFIDSIAKGKAMMPAWKEKLNEEQIRALAAFVRKFAEQ
jgi:mono/diheme cytochrome c family protein